MGIRINKISIKNFKLFNNLETIEFENPSLVVLDGPNGFGKTSFYDAMEILFTGSLRRYKSLVDIIDGRGTQSINDNPIVCNKSSDDEDLIIKTEVEIYGETYILMRKEACAVLSDTINFKTFCLPLYQLGDFESNDGQLIEDGVAFFNNLLRIDFNKNFSFLNYIEQEDNTFFLKRKDKERQSVISHLFNTNEIELKIQKIKTVNDKLNESCNKVAKKEYEEILEKREEYISYLLLDAEETKYIELFEEKNVSFDKEELDFSSGNFSQWLGEEGEINRLILFIKNFRDFEKKLFNNKIEELTKDDNKLKNLLIYYNFLEKSVELNIQLNINKKIESFIKTLNKGTLNTFQKEEIDLPIEVEEILKTSIDIEEYKKQVSLIKNNIKSSNKIETLLSSINESRNVFLAKYSEYIEDKDENTCPLCGFDWKEKKELIDNFKKQSEVLSELLKESAGELTILISEFDKIFIFPIRESLETYIEKYKIDKSFVTQLLDVKKNENIIKELHKEFINLNIDLSKFYNNELIVSKNIDTIVNTIKEMLNKRKELLSEENIKSYFMDYYVNYFDQKKENLLKEEQLLQKKKYINWKYKSYQDMEIQRLSVEYENKIMLFNNSLKLKRKTTKIIKIYNDHLKSYQEKLIKDIEILFHIYSGRIMQDYQNGLGLFIKEDGVGIRFIESVNIKEGVADYNKYDAIFSMSSGQLASLVISFTLALNKRYSKSKLLFIDDPVQTLDELNIAGFINLLRNEFSDRQIFMSTHEEMMSAYMRYKFDKFGLSTKQINFKEKYIE